MPDNDEADAQYEFTFGDSARARHSSPAPEPPLPPPAAMPPPAADATLNDSNARAIDLRSLFFETRRKKAQTR